LKTAVVTHKTARNEIVRQFEMLAYEEREDICVFYGLYFLIRRKVYPRVNLPANLVRSQRRIFLMVFFVAALLRGVVIVKRLQFFLESGFIRSLFLLLCILSLLDGLLRVCELIIFSGASDKADKEKTPRAITKSAASSMIRLRLIFFL
jgi:hypothetical protein